MISTARRKAIALLTQAEELADGLGDKLGLAEAERALGKAHLARGELAKARACTERAVELYRETESRVALGVALRSLAEVEVASAVLSAAREHLKQSITVLEKVGNQVELARSWRSYADLLRRMPEHSTSAALADGVPRPGPDEVDRERLPGTGGRRGSERRRRQAHRQGDR